MDPADRQQNEIKKGKFTKKWQQEFASGKKKLTKMRLNEKNSLVEKTAKKIN